MSSVASLSLPAVMETSDFEYALDEALAEFDLTLSATAHAAAGRLVALEIASRLGLRPARRLLSRERETLLRMCLASTALGAPDA